jgi:hypothetical protein
LSRDTESVLTDVLPRWYPFRKEENEGVSTFATTPMRTVEIINDSIVVIVTTAMEDTILQNAPDRVRVQALVKIICRVAFRPPKELFVHNFEQYIYSTFIYNYFFKL